MEGRSDSCRARKLSAPLFLIAGLAMVLVAGAGCGSRPDGVTQQFYERMAALDLDGMSQLVCADERAEFRSAMEFLESTPNTGFRLEKFESQTESSDGTSATMKVSARITDSEGSEIPVSGRVRLVRKSGEWCITGERDGFHSLLGIADGVWAMLLGGRVVEWSGSHTDRPGDWVKAEAVVPVEAEEATPSSGPPRIKGAVVTTDSGLKYIDRRVGIGPMPEAGQTLIVHYRLWLEASGEQADSSLGREPLEFMLGQGIVIAGFEEGLATMREGGQRRLIVPPELGYGDAGEANIPPNSTLVFDVELVEVR
jgi:peptidylprolyl isomerase